MKFIDEKGRLFGKLNLIDLLVSLLLIAAIAAVGWKLVGKKAATAVSDTGRTLTYTVTVEDVPAAISDFAAEQIGTQLVNNSKLIDATITSVTAPRVGEVYATLEITIEGSGTFSSNVYTVGSQEVRVGYEYIVKTSQLELTGIITAMQISE